MKTKRSMRGDTVSDEKIIELYFKRADDAVAQTDKKYGNYLYPIAYNILGDRPDSEECGNDTYLALWNSIPPAGPDALPAYMTQIMRRIALN